MKIISAAFADIVEASALKQRAGRPLAVEQLEDRVCLTEALPKIIVSREGLDEHQQLLRRYYPEGFPEFDLSDKQFEAVLEKGLAVLDNEALARLALDPVNLRLLGQEIAETFPRAWWDALQAEGERLLGASGRELLPETIQTALAEMEELEGAMLVGGPLNGGAGHPPVRGRPWKFTCPADQCQWVRGQPADGFAGAQVEVYWRTDGALEVATVEGLLPGPGQRLEVQWLGRGAEVRGEGVTTGYDPAIVKPADGVPPVPGDRLQLRHLSTSPGGEQQEVLLNVEFPNPVA